MDKLFLAVLSGQNRIWAANCTLDKFPRARTVWSVYCCNRWWKLVWHLLFIVWIIDVNCQSVLLLTVAFLLFDCLFFYVKCVSGDAGKNSDCWLDLIWGISVCLLIPTCVYLSKCAKLWQLKYFVWFDSCSNAKNNSTIERC